MVAEFRGPPPHDLGWITVAFDPSIGNELGFVKLLHLAVALVSAPAAG